MRIKKLLTIVLVSLLFTMYSGAAFAIVEGKLTNAKTAKVQQNIRTMELAFVFDGPSDKNAGVSKAFQETITKSLYPDYKASFPKDLVFVGDWTEAGAKSASNKALASRAKMVISLGYMSSMYLTNKQNNNKFVLTIDEYGLRELGSNAFFNPVKQYVNDFILFKKLVPTQQKTAVLLNENFYKTQKDWHGIIDKKFKEKKLDMNFVVLPVSAKNLAGSLAKIPSDVDSVFVTPMFNLSVEQRKELYANLNSKKLPTFTSVGIEDVQLGALMGTSTPDLDRKLAEATSFSIHGVLHGKAVKNEKIQFFDDEVIYYNKDTGEELGYSAPLRLLNNAQVISHKEKPIYDLSYVLNTMSDNNLDIKRKKYLVDAARRSAVSSVLRYLPTLRIDLGHQTYNDSYAESYTDVPRTAGMFTVGIDQVIYSPDLVTNIIVKNKKLKFDKAEKIVTEQSVGHNLGNLYIETLIFENMIKVQEELVKESRENLAIARVREKAGKCGPEEALRWAGHVNEAEKKLLNMKAEFANLKITINKILFKDQKEEYNFKPLTAKDPAFFTSELHVINHVSTPEKLAKFTDMLVEEVIAISPETAKLRAAIAMKKAEMGNYAQKFFLPSAKLSLEYTKQFDRDLPYEQNGHYPAAGYAPYLSGNPNYLGPYYGLKEDSTRLLIAAQWKPIEGGHKIAEIARCKAELNELNAYLTQVNTELEMNVREVVNRAIAKYFLIEKSYKSMFAQAENYQRVKAKYLRGEAPIAQLVDAQDLYTHSKVDAMNSQYNFFKELLWVQRGLLAINWTQANDRAKKWIHDIPGILPAVEDFTL
ncbi:MAG: TolC family protein [Candidatus Gastranaerophilales bacterium]|nr:TolC family protein [Candidatus Gastranaerophilales bacterium]